MRTCPHTCLQNSSLAFLTSCKHHGQINKTFCCGIKQLSALQKECYSVHWAPLEGPQHRLFWLFYNCILSHTRLISAVVRCKAKPSSFSLKGAPVFGASIALTVKLQLFLYLEQCTCHRPSQSASIERDRHGSNPQKNKSMACTEHH